MSIYQPETTYRQRRDAFATRRAAFTRQSDRAANLNLALFVAALLALAAGTWGGIALALPLAAFLAMLFVASFVRHGRINRQQRRFDALWTLNDAGLARLSRDWEHLPLRAYEPAAAAHPYAADLDLSGRASLLHLVATASSPAGQRTLRSWLLAPAAAETVARRQEAVAELAPGLDLRDELALRGQGVGDRQRHYEQFQHWAEQQPWLLHQPRLIWLSRLLPLATILLFAAQTLGLTPYPLALLPYLASVLLSFAVSKQADELIDAVAEKQDTFRAYSDLFTLIVPQRWSCRELQRLQGQLATGDSSAEQALRRLARLMPLADVRHWMFFLPIQWLTLWNLHVLLLLERWRRQAGTSVGPWLGALGELEALAALATLHYDHPDWCFPQIDPAAPTLSASNLGHPLLPDGARVDNDVALGPAGTFLLITGSNMSGKSTLLRSIGLNVVLAQAGGPVCADALRMPPLALATAMRVQDSLDQGVSYFMAELRRLKLVVDQAQLVREEGHYTLLFLLDEILQGTNTAERQIAARQIILHLLALGATGAVSTHDLSLADAPDLASRSQRFYLTEQLGDDGDGPQMSFDYLLRPGIAPSSNALKLMELVGLPAAEPALPQQVVDEG